MKQNSKILNFFVGALALFLGTIIYGLLNGDIGEALDSLSFFALISIVCTYGFGLVVWIPALYILGAIVTSMFSILFGLQVPTPSDVENTHNIAPTSSKNELAIIGYINDSRSSGTINDATIKSNLKTGGWSDVEIENAFKKSSAR